jgi:hypothetical protein
MRIPNPFSANVGDSLLRVCSAGATRDIDCLIKLAESRNVGISGVVMRSSCDVINDLIVESILAGYVVDTGIFLVEANVNGTWPEGSEFDPRRHKVSVSARLVKSVREKLKSVSLLLSGHKHSNDYASIDGVRDVLSGLTDKSITVGDDIEVLGSRIRVQGMVEGGVTESAVGIFLLPVLGGEVVRITRINRNDPSLLNIRIPASLPVDREWRLRIVTRYSSTGKDMLKHLRTVEYPYALTSKAPSSC